MRELADGKSLWTFKLNETESFIQLRQDIQTVVLTAKHHGQQAEAGVQEISLCTSNRKSESVASGMWWLHGHTIING